MSSVRTPAFAAAFSMCSRGIGARGSRYGPLPSRSRVGRMRPNLECISPSMEQAAPRPVGRASRRAGRSGRGSPGPATSPPTPGRRAAGVRVAILDGAPGEQVAGRLVRPLLRQRPLRAAPRGRAGHPQCAPGEQVAGRLVRPLLRQRPCARCGVRVAVLDAHPASRSRVVWSGHFSANARTPCCGGPRRHP